ncbi:hypothetical protein TNCV_3257581 [Trichonephila clavipes]|nr:hypothetical protein TNCV_3257581 [Trichonephila clavipes]
MDKIWKPTTEFDCPILLSGEFTEVDHVNVCTAPIMAEKELVELAQSSKYTIVTDSDNENEMNNVAPVPTSSEIRNIMKSMYSYVFTHTNGEMNKNGRHRTIGW